MIHWNALGKKCNALRRSLLCPHLDLGAKIWKELTRAARVTFFRTSSQDSAASQDLALSKKLRSSPCS